MPRTKMIKKKKSSVKRFKQSSISSHKLNESNVTTVADKNEALTTLLSADYESYSHFRDAVEVYYDNKMKMHEEGYKKACTSLKECISGLLSRMPEHVLNCNIEHSLESLWGDENEEPTKNSRAVRESRSRKSDLVEFKKPKTPKVGKRSSSRKRSASVSSLLAPPRDNFKTPVMVSRKIPHYKTITPKISDTPMSVMRRPVQGEIAVSMSGSPLMVSAVSREDVPTVNVPLMDGRVFSIVPQPGAPPIDLPQFDKATLQHLKTLQKHLRILAPSTP